MHAQWLQRQGEGLMASEAKLVDHDTKLAQVNTDQAAECDLLAKLKEEADEA